MITLEPGRRGGRFCIMKPNDLKLSDPDMVSEELLPEYRFDYSKARPNRFASRGCAPRASGKQFPACRTGDSESAGIRDAV
jgi:hypothetical protein